MREIKFLSHLSRNIYLYFGLYFILFFIANYQVDIILLLLGLLTFFVGYAPVYFLNDYIDRDEDAKHNKANLYAYFIDAKIYWLITILLVIIGITLSYFVNPTSVILLILMYVCNFFYSVKPFRLRNKFLLNTVCIFIIYAIKIYYVMLLLQFPIEQFPVSFVIMSSSLAALSVAFYKRHKVRDKVSEYLFSFLVVTSWLVTIIMYEQLFFLLFPLLFVLFYFHLKYKQKQIPIGRYQSLYFIYGVIIWFIYIYY